MKIKWLRSARVLSAAALQDSDLVQEARCELLAFLAVYAFRDLEGEAVVFLGFVDEPKSQVARAHQAMQGELHFRVYRFVRVEVPIEVPS